MLVIFGTTERHTEPLNPKILFNACPKCSSNMKSKDVKTWISLFFIPVFPIKTHDPIYQCENCRATVIM